ncbi:MAG: hypothetical protein ABEJ03_06260 [Candidatus Nanohaloarchaea archaeon]
MGFIPDKMVDIHWREEEREISISDEIKGKSGDEVIDQIREKKTLNLD